MTNLLFLPIFSFAITIFSALVFFAAGWTHLDAWKLSKQSKTYLLRGVGFLLVSLSYFLMAGEILTPAIYIIRIAGFIMVLVSLLSEPILPMPSKSILNIIPIATNAIILYAIGIVYLIKATRGLEKQIMPAFWGIFTVGIAEVLYALLEIPTDNLILSKLLDTYGPLWLASFILQFIGVSILIYWVWGYLRFQISAQIFLSIITAVLSIFVVTTAAFTAILFGRVEKESVDNLETNVNVIYFALERMQNESLTNSRAIAENADIIKSLESGNQTNLVNTSTTFLLSQQTDFLHITDSEGKRILAAEDPGSPIVSLSEDSEIIEALSGKPLSNIVKKTLGNSPSIQVRSAYPIKSNGQIIGTVLTGYVINNTFVDSIKDSTGLEITIFAGDVRSATTLISQDGKSRFIGTTLSDKNISQIVLSGGKTYKGRATIFNKPYLVAYSPLKSYGGEVVGILGSAKHQQELTNAIGETTKKTFFASVLLMIASILPSYYVAKFIERNASA